MIYSGKDFERMEKAEERNKRIEVVLLFIAMLFFGGLIAYALVNLF